MVYEPISTWLLLFSVFISAPAPHCSYIVTLSKKCWADMLLHANDTKTQEAKIKFSLGYRASHYLSKQIRKQMHGYRITLLVFFRIYKDIKDLPWLLSSNVVQKDMCICRFFFKKISLYMSTNCLVKIWMRIKWNL